MSQTPLAPNGGTVYRTPLWVKTFGIIALVLVILLGIMLLSGVQHGPGMHMPSSGNTPSVNSTQESASQHGMKHQ